MQDSKCEVVWKDIKDIKPYENNPRHNDEAVEYVANSIREFGFKVPIVIDDSNTIIAGHTRYKASKLLKLDSIPCVVASDLTDEQIKAFRLADNKVAEISYWNEDALQIELDSIENIAMTDFGFEIDVDNLEDEDDEKKQTLNDRFLVPPFSVLNAREGKWLDRKRWWVQLGIASEESREDMVASGSFSGTTPGYYNYKEKEEKRLGRKLSNKEFEDKYLSKYISKDSLIKQTNSGGILSVFDPVLCEVLYYWFAFPGAKVIDPFSGGSVRGIVASMLGLDYTGVDLRKAQVEANIKQANSINLDKYIQPKWIQGNSVHIDEIANGEYDFVFSCPPYADLEVYSDSPEDLSNQPYDEFVSNYRAIIKNAVSMLKNDRFACFVVGEVRDKKGGGYRNFVADTIQAFIDAGMKYYNEIILVNSVGSLAIRAGRVFKSSRKVGKSHQNVLVFYKGDIKNIKNIYKDIDILEIEEEIVD